MTLSTTQYNAQLARVRSGQNPDYARCSVKQRLALQLLARSLQSAKQQKKASGAAQATAPKLKKAKTLLQNQQQQQQIVAQRSALGSARGGRYVSHADYKNLYLARRAQGPVPRPHFTGTQGPRYTAVTARTANVYYSLPANSVILVQPVISHGRVGLVLLNVANPDVNGADWTFTSMRQGNPYLTTTAATAAFPMNIFQTTAPDIFTGAVDVFGYPSPPTQDDVAAHTVPWTQLQGGKLRVDVSTTFDGSARVYTIAYGRNPIFSCAANGQEMYDGRNNANFDPNFRTCLRLPTVPVSNTISQVAQQFGEASQIPGNSSRSFDLTLPADKGWFRPGALAVVNDGNTSAINYANGYAPTRNPIFAWQYGAVMIANTGTTGTTVTIAAQSEQTYVVTWPDFAQNDITGNADPIRSGLIQKAPNLANTVYNSAKTLVSHIIGGDTTKTPQAPPGFKHEDVSHHKDDKGVKVAEGAIAAGVVGHQTGLLSRGWNAIKGWAGAAEDAVVKAAPEIAEDGVIVGEDLIATGIVL